MNGKNFENDFLTIKEFAELVGVSVSTLRYYDKIGVFIPAKRGIEHGNQYRLYSPHQITTIKMIRVLTEIGIPLQTIKALTQHRTPETMLKLFSKYKNKVASEINSLQNVYSVISTFTDLLIEAISATETEISLSVMPEKRLMFGGINDFGGEIGFPIGHSRFCHDKRRLALTESLPIGGYWESMPAFISEPSQPVRFFSVDPKGRERKEAGLYLVGYMRGYCGQTNGIPEQMEAYAKKNGLVFTGPVYNIYLSDEISEIDPNNYLLQISVPVKETRRVTTYRLRRSF